MDRIRGKLRDNKGFELVEMIMVMALLALFGVTIFTLIISGAQTQDRVMAEKEAQTNARIAASYINVRLRQSDSAGKVSVEPIELTGENALLIRERAEDWEYDTWIFVYDGVLMECLVDPGEPPDDLFSFDIVEIGALDIEYDGDGSAVNYTIYYESGGTTRSLESTVCLRSY